MIERKPITPAMKKVLAYVYAFGWMPSHVHSKTYCDCLDWLEENRTCGRYKQPVAEAMPFIAEMPMVIAHDYLTAEGFKPDRQRIKRTSHYVSYRRFNAEGFDDEATSYRSSEYITVYPCGSYRNNVKVTIDEMKAALA